MSWKTFQNISTLSLRDIKTIDTNETYTIIAIQYKYDVKLYTFKSIINIKFFFFFLLHVTQNDKLKNGLHSSYHLVLEELYETCLNLYFKGNYFSGVKHYPQHECVSVVCKIIIYMNLESNSFCLWFMTEAYPCQVQNNWKIKMILLLGTVKV